MLEQVSEPTAVVLDKIGTLTMDEPAVADVRVVDGPDETDLAGVATAMSLSRATVRKMRQNLAGQWATTSLALLLRRVKVP